MPDPYLFDPKGKLTIRGPNGPEEERLVNTIGATSIVADKTGFAGVYVDNEAGEGPLGSAEQRGNRDRIALELRKAIFPGQHVLVGLWPWEPEHRLPHCLCLLEWYPFHRGWGMPTKGALALTAAEPWPEGWIIQWRFAWASDRPPSRAERWRLWAFVKLRRPRLILGY